jgi:hypothetical protein
VSLQESFDLSGGVLHPVENTHHADIEVIAPLNASRCLVPREAEEMISFLQRQVHSSGDRGQELLGWQWAALLLDSTVVVAGDAAEGSDFLSPESLGAASRAARQADVFGLEGFTSGAEKVRQLRAIHMSLAFDMPGS